MKAYLNETNIVIAVGYNDELFQGFTSVEITQEEKELIESFKLPKKIGKNFVDGLTIENELSLKIQRAIEIDLYYTKKISDLMIKHNDKFIEALYNGNTYTIPQTALDEKQTLKDECNEKIAELGITDYTYRQSIPKLAKTL